MVPTKESITTAREALEAETQEVVQVSNRLHDNLAQAGKKIWRQVMVIWAVGIVLAISYFLVLNRTPITSIQTPPSPVSQPDTRARAGTAGPAESFPSSSQEIYVSPAVPVQEELIKLLNQIREAQLKKDIHLFMEAYSRDFPDLQQKRETTLTIWKKYIYLDAQFKLTDLQQKDSATIFAKVNWDIKAKEQKNSAIRIFTKSYQVIFSKESGVWLIHNLKSIDSKSDKID
jgi:hypothetical protein